MSIVLIRMFWGVYIAVMLAFIVMAVSDFAFRKNAKLSLLLKRLSLAPLWFLAITSKAGRKTLFNNTKGL